MINMIVDIYVTEPAMVTLCIHLKTTVHSMDVL